MIMPLFTDKTQYSYGDKLSSLSNSCTLPSSCIYTFSHSEHIDKVTTTSQLMPTTCTDCCRSDIIRRRRPRFCAHSMIRCKQNQLLQDDRMGKGCASVFSTHLFRGNRSSSENIRYKYLSVSAKKKLCCTSSCGGLIWQTSRIPLQPPSTRHHFSRACRKTHYNEGDQ